MPFSPGEAKVLKLFYDRQMAVHALANIGYLLLGPEVGMRTPAAALSDWGFDMLEQGGLA
jgi:hypothetical protein